MSKTQPNVQLVGIINIAAWTVVFGKPGPSIQKSESMVIFYVVNSDLNSHSLSGSLKFRMELIGTIWHSFTIMKGDVNRSLTGARY